MKGASKGIGIFLIIFGGLLMVFGVSAPIGVFIIVLGVLFLILGGINFGKIGLIGIILVASAFLFILILIKGSDFLIPIIAVGGLLAMVYIMQKKSL